MKVMSAACTHTDPYRDSVTLVCVMLEGGGGGREKGKNWKKNKERTKSKKKE